MSASAELIERGDGRIELRLAPFDLVCFDNERIYLDYVNEETRAFSIDDLRSLKQVVDRMLRELER